MRLLHRSAFLMYILITVPRTNGVLAKNYENDIFVCHGGQRFKKEQPVLELLLLIQPL